MKYSITFNKNFVLREFPLEITDSFKMMHMYEGFTLYGQGTTPVSIP